jgi:hypothetical protein
MDRGAVKLFPMRLYDHMKADEGIVDRANNNANQQDPPHASPAQGPGSALPPPPGK